MTRTLVVAAALVAAACGPPLMKLPSGGGTSLDAAAAAAALGQATAGCSAIRTLTAEIAVTGSASGQRVRGRLSVGVAAPASARLEAVAPFGPPFFILVTSGPTATLFLPRDERVLRGAQPDAVLDAVAGVPLGARDLEATLTGCVATAPPGTLMTATGFGDQWLLVAAGDDDLYLRRDGAAAPWHLDAVVRRQGTARWRADYADRQNDVPRSIRLTSVDDRGQTGKAFDLRLALSQVDVNTPLGPEVFTIDLPPTAAPMTLDDARRAGVTGGR